MVSLRLAGPSFITWNRLLRSSDRFGKELAMSDVSLIGSHLLLSTSPLEVLLKDIVPGGVVAKPGHGSGGGPDQNTVAGQLSGIIQDRVEISVAAMLQSPKSGSGGDSGGMPAVPASPAVSTPNSGPGPTGGGVAGTLGVMAAGAAGEAGADGKDMTKMLTGAIALSLVA